MHGVIFKELKDFVTANHGEGTWRDLLDEADTENQMFMPTRAYPDEDAVAIVETAAEVTGRDVADILFDFGVFTGPHLTDMYAAQIEDDWGYFDVLENTEEQIHKVVRKDKPEAEPPELDATRLGDEEVRIDYRSERQMCPLLRGIAQGLADDYGVDVAITQGDCMLEGDGRCRVNVRAS